MPKVLFVIAPEEVNDEEYFTPKQILENKDIEVTTVSKDREATSMNGETIDVDVLLKEVNIVGYDGVIFIGGAGAETYFNDAKAKTLAKRFFENNKLVAAICISPSILANAGVLKGKRATAFPSEEDNLNEKGAIYTQDSVVVDGNIITGKNPAAAKEFGNKILKYLEG